MSVWATNDLGVTDAKIDAVQATVNGTATSAELAVTDGKVDLLATSTALAATDGKVDNAVSAIGTTNTNLGTYADHHDTATLAGILHTLLDHIHSPGKVYPTLANGITVQGAAGAWGLGNKVEVVPANTITSDYDVHFVVVESAPNDTFELVLYQGASDVEVGRVVIVNSANVDVLTVPCMTSLIPANARLRAAIASKGGGSDTVVFYIQYHTY